jgi:hypothetical protein
MLLSSIRKRYNDLKDLPEERRGAATRSNTTRISHLDDGYTQDGQKHQDSPSLLRNSEKDGLKPVTAALHETDSNDFADDDPAIRDIPLTVRNIVSFHDDPTLPTLTFRYFVLTLLFVSPGAFLSQMSHYRTTYAPYSVLFVQIASNYAGLWLAKVLPAMRVGVPFTKYGFSLNPGPWSIKEHVLVTISAASGATYNLA